MVAASPATSRWCLTQRQQHDVRLEVKAGCRSAAHCATCSTTQAGRTAGAVIAGAFSRATQRWPASPAAGPVAWPRQTAAAAAGASPAADLEVDVCVLGAGIIGLCTSLALLRADPRLRVAVVDRQVPCAGATGAGQGYLWLAHRDVGSPLFRLAASSKDMWRELLAPEVPELTEQAVEWQEVGSMLIASTQEESEALQRRQELLSLEGLQARLLTAAEAVHLEPALRLGAEGSALLMPSDLQVSGRATAAALQRACEAHGSRFTTLFDEGALHLAGGESGRVEVVKTGARRVRAPRGIVVALGAWSGAFLAQQLADVRWAGAFRPRRGLLLEMPRPEGMPAVSHGLMEVGYTQHYNRRGSGADGEESPGPGPLAAPLAVDGLGIVSEQEDTAEEGGVDITFTATTSASGSLLVGSSREFAGYDRDAPEAVVEAIMERAAQFLPGLAAVQRGDIHVRAGPRPYATSGAPMVGPVPGVEGLLVAAGHEGSGLTMAPATASLVCDYLFERPSRLDVGVIEALKCPFGLHIENYLSM